MFSGDQQIFIDIALLVARNDRRAGGLHGSPRGGLRSHHADHIAIRADPGETSRRDSIGKGSIFGQKAIAGVDGVTVVVSCSSQNQIAPQVGGTGRDGTEVDGLVSQGGMKGVGVGIGVDSNGSNAHLLAGADDADGDFATVGDENF